VLEVNIIYYWVLKCSDSAVYFGFLCIVSLIQEDLAVFVYILFKHKSTHPVFYIIMCIIDAFHNEYSFDVKSDVCVLY